MREAGGWQILWVATGESRWQQRSCSERAGRQPRSIDVSVLISRIMRPTRGQSSQTVILCENNVCESHAGGLSMSVE